MEVRKHGLSQKMAREMLSRAAKAAAKRFGRWDDLLKHVPVRKGDFFFVPSGTIMFIEAPVILFIAWSNVIGTQYLMPVKRVNEFTASVTAGAITNIVLNFLLIPRYTANGAAIATVIAEFAVAAVQLQCVRTTIRRRDLFRNIWRYLLPGGLMSWVVYHISEMMSMNIINLAFQAAVGVIIYGLGIMMLKAPIVDQAKQILSKSK